MTVAVNAPADSAIADVMREMIHQDQLWGSKRDHHGLIWLSILVEELGEVAQIMNDDRRLIDGYRELTHVAAVAVQWMESIKRKMEKGSE